MLGSAMSSLSAGMQVFAEVTTTAVSSARDSIKSNVIDPTAAKVCVKLSAKCSAPLSLLCPVQAAVHEACTFPMMI